MIIGLSGYIGSGKDTVGQMIVDSMGSYEAREDMGSGYQWKWKDEPVYIKKFAGKLKEVASLLTGISVEKFEDQAFKKTELGPEWTRWGIDGDHDFLPQDYGYVRLYKEAVELACQVGESPEFIKEYKYSVREFLQRLGTEAMRDGLHKNVWVNALFADYKPTGAKKSRIVEANTYGTHPAGTVFFDSYPNWVVTDVRFPNEAEAIKNWGGYLVRINRPERRHDETRDVARHPSEISLDEWKFDYVIENDGDLFDLEKKVKDLLAEINKINLQE